MSPAGQQETTPVLPPSSSLQRERAPSLMRRMARAFSLSRSSRQAPPKTPVTPSEATAHEEQHSRQDSAAPSQGTDELQRETAGSSLSDAGVSDGPSTGSTADHVFDTPADTPRVLPTAGPWSTASTLSAPASRPQTAVTDTETATVQPVGTSWCLGTVRVLHVALSAEEALLDYALGPDSASYPPPGQPSQGWAARVMRAPLLRAWRAAGGDDQRLLSRLEGGKQDGSRSDWKQRDRERG